MRFEYFGARQLTVAFCCQRKCFVSVFRGLISIHLNITGFSMIPSTWDELRIQARVLESEIDSKLAAFGKIGTRPVEHKHIPRFTNSGIISKSNVIPEVPSHVDFDTNFNVMCNEIEEQLQR